MRLPAPLQSSQLNWFTACRRRRYGARVPCPAEVKRRSEGDGEGEGRGRSQSMFDGAHRSLRRRRCGPHMADGGSSRAVTVDPRTVAVADIARPIGACAVTATKHILRHARPAPPGRARSRRLYRYTSADLEMGTSFSPSTPSADTHHTRRSSLPKLARGQPQRGKLPRSSQALMVASPGERSRCRGVLARLPQTLAAASRVVRCAQPPPWRILALPRTRSSSLLVSHCHGHGRLARLLLPCLWLCMLASSKCVACLLARIWPSLLAFRLAELMLAAMLAAELVQPRRAAWAGRLVLLAQEEHSHLFA